MQTVLMLHMKCREEWGISASSEGVLSLKEQISSTSHTDLHRVASGQAAICAQFYPWSLWQAKDYVVQKHKL